MAAGSRLDSRRKKIIAGTGVVVGCVLVIVFLIVPLLDRPGPPITVGSDRIGIWQAGWFRLDYDGDGVWDPEKDKAINFGLATDTPVIGDWNGDGKDSVGVWRDGWFYLDYDGDGVWDSAVDKATDFGQDGGISVIGDWNGDGKDQIGVWQDSWFHLDYDGDGVWEPEMDVSLEFGLATDTPIIGHW